MNDMPDPTIFLKSMTADSRQQTDAANFARDEARAWDDYAIAWINNQPPTRGVCLQDADAIEVFANEMLARRRRSMGEL